MTFNYRNYIPKSVICLREGYKWHDLFYDLFAGISIAIIAYPLALAFAIASGLSPEKGLFTAIIAGFLISLLGGSRVQIGGPTGAFVVIVLQTVQKHGYEGLALATLIAGVILILMGLAKFGALLKFIPYPVTVGFTSGIAVVIFLSQVNDFLGITFSATSYAWNYWSFIIAGSTLSLLFLFKHYLPKWPSAIIAVILSTLAVQFFNLPVTSVADKFGELPSSLPAPSLPHFSFELFRNVFPDAITIALLGAIESLLSAVVADGLTGHKHRPNCELVAQGFANIGSIIFGGMPATGAIARTNANIRLGAKTPFAGMFHAVVLLFFLLFLSPLAGKIPLACLAGILVYVAWNMSEYQHFIEILRGQKGDALVLLITFLLTVVIDLAVAVQVGILLAAIIFMKRMTDRTTVVASNLIVMDEEEDSPDKDDDLYPEKLKSDTVIFEIQGPFFYSVADILDEALFNLDENPKLFILRLIRTSLIDATGLQSLKKFVKKCQQKGITFLISDANSYHRDILKCSNGEIISEDHIFDTLDQALSYWKKQSN